MSCLRVFDCIVLGGVNLDADLNVVLDVALNGVLDFVVIGSMASHLLPSRSLYTTQQTTKSQQYKYKAISSLVLNFLALETSKLKPYIPM